MSKDLDINSYSIEDLFAFFKIDEPINKTRIDYQINQTIRTFLEKFDNDYENEYIQFFYKCKDKIHKHLDSEINLLNIKKQVQEPIYVPNSINPIEKKYVTKIVNIDTLFRDNYIQQKATNFIFKIPEPIKHVIKMKLSAIEIPHSWYMINTRNNFLYIDDIEIKVKPGNYDSKTFPIAFKEALVIAKCDKLDDNEPLTIDSITQKTTINIKQCNKNTIIKLQSQHSNNYNQSLGWFLGFKQMNYTINCKKEKQKIESEGTFGSGIGKYIFLEVNDFNNNSKQSLISFTNKTQLSNNILGRITILPTDYTYIVDNASDLIFKERDYFGPVTIEKLQIKLLDHYGNEIDLNYNDYSFALEFTQIYS